VFTGCGVFSSICGDRLIKQPARSMENKLVVAIIE